MNAEKKFDTQPKTRCLLVTLAKASSHNEPKSYPTQILVLVIVILMKIFYHESDVIIVVSVQFSLAAISFFFP